MSKAQDFLNIKESNEEMLRYFNAVYSEHTSELQIHKSRLFEINVKLDELVKTKSIYTYNSDFRKNLFSPINTEQSENEKESEIRKEIEELSSERDELEEKIDYENRYIKSIETRLTKLNRAKNSISSLKQEMGYTDERLETEARVADSDFKDSITASTDSIKAHGKNIMMIDVFDKTYSSTVIDKRIKSEIGSNNRKLEMIRDVVRTDPTRAKVTVDEVIQNNKNMLLVLQDQLTRADYYFDDKKTVTQMIDDFLDDVRNRHPEMAIDLEITNMDLQPSFARQLSLYKLLSIFFDNIIKHSKASHITLKVTEIEKKLYVNLNDNGVGIKDEDIVKAVWYSGINRAKEIIFLLDGKLSITSDDSEGTTVKFKFDID